MVPPKQPLDSVGCRTSEAQKDASHDHTHEKQGGSRIDGPANRRLPQEVSRTPSLLSLLPLLSLSSVIAGPSGERKLSSFGCVSVHNRIAIVASASFDWSLTVFTSWIWTLVTVGKESVMSLATLDVVRPTVASRHAVPAIGYALREQNRYILNDPAINAVEITFERADDPLRIDRYLGEQEFEHVGIHALKLSVASPDAPGHNYLDTLRTIAEENDAESISDHLGFTRDGHNGVEMGHFAPPPFTPAALDVTCRNIDFVQTFFARRDLRFYIENIAYLFRFEGTMSEAQFLSRVLHNTGCGWLLDVTNVYANATNFGFDAYEFIAEVMPSADRVQLHLAGGFFDEQAGMYIDSHSEPIPEPVWNLYRHALDQGRGKIDAVFLERDQNYPDERGWRREIRQVRAIAEETYCSR